MQKLRIAYTGPALENGEMDVEDLAPALIAFARFVKRTNEIIGNTQDVNLKLNADSIRIGSFEVILDLAYTSIDKLKLFTGWTEEVGLKALLEVIGYGVDVKNCIFWFIKAIEGRVILEASNQPNNITKLFFDNGSTLDVSTNTYNIYVDKDAREYIENIIKPLDNAGVENFELRDAKNFSNKQPLLKVNKKDTKLYQAPKSTNKDVISSNDIEIIVKIINVAFNNDKQWRFDDGDVEFKAKIDDESFVNKVCAGSIAFRAGDRLRVICRTIQKNGEAGNILKERIILEVKEIIPAPEQTTLNF